MHHRGGHARQQADEWLDSPGGRLAPRTAPFCDDGLQYATTITKGVQVTHSVNSRVLEAWDLNDD